MTEIFSDFARYYDLLYADKDYVAEAKYFHGLIQKWQRFESKSILEFGAGTGKHQAEFTKLGYSAQGADLSEQMVSIAQAAGHRVEVGDFRDYQNPEKVDVVLALFHVVSYLTTDVDVKRAFSNVAKNLRPGGLFIFDVWFTDAVLAHKPELRVKRVKTEEVELLRISEPHLGSASKQIDVIFTLLSRPRGEENWAMDTEVHKMRHFSISEMAEFMEAAGIHLLTSESTVTGEEPSVESWGVSLVGTLNHWRLGEN